MLDDDPFPPPPIDPTTASLVRTPPGQGSGYWAGGHKVSHDPITGNFVLDCRQRQPLELERERGGECAVAVSRNGIHFDDAWLAAKAELDATSIEVGHCLRFGEEWRLYVSYERHGEWRIDLIRGADPSALDT